MIDSIIVALSCNDPFDFRLVNRLLQEQNLPNIPAAIFISTIGEALFAITQFPDLPLEQALDASRDYIAATMMQEYHPDYISEEVLPDIATLPQQLESATEAIYNYVASGFETVDKVLRAERLQLCKDCVEGDTHILVNGRCKYCGCFMTIKTWLPREKCPKGLW